MNYLDRLIDSTIDEALQTKGCVVIEGPKWCGKSTTGKRFAKTVVALQNPSTYKMYKLLSDTGDRDLLSGEKPLMFDEWQKIADLWDCIRADIDDRGGERGLYILTGSAKPTEDPNRHSGIGRMKKIVMRPMSLWESKESSGVVSVQDLFSGKAISFGKDAEKSLRDIAHIICRGGWPQAVTEINPKFKLKAAKDYVETLVETDITGVDEIKRNPARARLILRAYARNISQAAKFQTLQKDMEANDEALDIRTIDSYISAFKKLFVIEDVEAWSPKLRSQTTIRTSATRQFIDPSVAASLLDANPNDLMTDLNTFGSLFESLAIRDLRIYAQKIDGKVYNFHNARGLEVDAIIHLDNGKWGALEIKLGGDELVNEGAQSLLKLKSDVDTERMKQPEFLMVVTATGYAYKRPDGVLVVPIGCLKN
jgi:predicted AAA+ superfamily ATPase